MSDAETPRHVTLAKCERCNRSFPRHMWGAIRAHDEGWFQGRDGRVWCPSHVPEWVESWRARTTADYRRSANRQATGIALPPKGSTNV